MEILFGPDHRNKASIIIKRVIYFLLVKGFAFNLKKKKKKKEKIATSVKSKNSKQSAMKRGTLVYWKEEFDHSREGDC